MLQLPAPDTATVLDLRRAIERTVLANRRQALRGLTGGIKTINWRSVWRATTLDYDGSRLDDANRKLSDYGLTLDTSRRMTRTVRFVRRKFTKASARGRQR